MSDEKNALAKLCTYLAIYRDFHRDDDRVNDHILTKAQRIVAEVAKVENRREGETNSDSLWRCNDCIAKCRVIAEEGVKDGK